MKVNLRLEGMDSVTIVNKNHQSVAGSGYPVNKIRQSTVVNCLIH